MRFLSICVSALSLLSGLVAAQENPIIFPGTGATLQAGQTYSITWKPTTSSNGITLALRYGPARNLVSSSVIAVNVENNGAASWTVPNGIGNGQWAIEIVDSSGNINYSPVFTVTGGTGTQGVAAVTSTLVASTATFTPLITGAIPTGSQSLQTATTTVSGAVMTVTRLVGASSSGTSGSATGDAIALSGRGAALAAAGLGAVAFFV